MRILITGASGFIGSRLAHALAGHGHELVCTLRDPSQAAAGVLPGRVVQADLARLLTAADWQAHLHGVEVVVNAVGILRETAGQRFATLHVAGPCALFSACATEGVRRVVQISALGADAGARSGYHTSKKAADDFLLQLPLAAVVVQPSLVYGPGGGSARLFTRLASLPLIPLPGEGEQQLQPIHIDDLVPAIVGLIEGSVAGDAFVGERVPLVGPAPLSLRQWLTELRAAMDLGPASFVRVPLPLVRAGASLGRRLSGQLLDPETLAMLERGNTASAAATCRLLGHSPRPVSAFIAPPSVEGTRSVALLAWLLPGLRMSVAAVWIVTGIVSLGLYPVTESHALLARVGVSPALAPFLRQGAALLDLGLGVATLTCHRRRWLWWAQIALIVVYTLIITVYLPEFWLHPFGPLVKNLPLLAVLGLLLAFEKR